MKILFVILTAVMLTGCNCETNYGPTNPDEPDNTEIQASCDTSGISGLFNFLGNFGVGVTAAN